MSSASIALAALSLVSQIDCLTLGGGCTHRVTFFGLAAATGVLAAATGFVSTTSLLAADDPVALGSGSTAASSRTASNSSPR